MADVFYSTGKVHWFHNFLQSVYFPEYFILFFVFCFSQSTDEIIVLAKPYLMLSFQKKPKNNNQKYKTTQNNLITCHIKTRNIYSSYEIFIKIVCTHWYCSQSSVDDNYENRRTIFSPSTTSPSLVCVWTHIRLVYLNT